MLDIPLEEAQEAATADKIERRYGPERVYGVQGRDPRLADIEPLMIRLSDQEWDLIMMFVRGYVNEKNRPTSPTS